MTYIQNHNDPVEMPTTVLLELKAMTKTFPGVKANDNVNLTLNTGEIHALLGENGAGKSTLVKMIYGILKADSGQIRWLGEPVNIGNPATARSLGIAMVFQNFSLFDSMSVLENIVLGMGKEAQRGIDKAIDKTTLEQQIIDISSRYGLPLDPDRHVYTLSVGECQRIEIIRCLLQHPKLLIMDEPTSVLTPQEVSKLFETLNRLSAEGMAILYISHKLGEIKTLCQQATILRAGKVVETVPVAGQSTQSLAAKMMGAELPSNPPNADDSKRKVGHICLNVHNLNHPPGNQFGISLKTINLQVRSGEIVGIAGVAGNGQDELLKVLNGEQLSTPANAICIDNQPCANSAPNQRRALGMASIPEERLGHGAVPAMSLIDNALLTAFQRLDLLRFGFIEYRQSRKYCHAIVDDFNVKSNGITAEVGSLSGGNLQKFIVGREIKQSPTLLIVSQPTWGVDAGATRTIHHALRELADNGTAILVISQDLDELMAISDRIAAICGGELSPATPTSAMTIEQIGLLMAGMVGNTVAREN